MTVAGEHGDLTLADALRIIRRAVRDRSYRGTPLGLDVASYYRWKKNEWGAAPDTLRDYEPILAKTALYAAANWPEAGILDFAPPRGTEMLREVWDHYWGDKTARTRSKVRSVWGDFFAWGMRERGLVGNPAHGLTAPKKRDVAIDIFSPAFVDTVIGAQEYQADIIGSALILKYGLRKGGVQNSQRKHWDFERRLLEVHTKGGRIFRLPIVEDWIWRRFGELELVAQLQPDDYLLYRLDTRRMKVPLDEATEILEVGGQKVGYAWVTRRFHDKRPGQHKVHSWWYGCLERAGVVPKGTTAGTNMHRGRHTAITTLLRSSHDLKLAQLLAGHRDIKTTARYAQLDTADLAAALREMNGED